MLDDLKLIHKRDTQDALGVAARQWQQYLHKFGFQWKTPKPIYDVIVAGMGGSGLAAKAYKTVSKLDVPVEIVQDYDLPNYANENTLLICSSYSGNTEETLSVFNQATDPDRLYPAPMVVAMASGGRLLELARTKNIPFIKFPTDLQPRMTFGLQYRALAEIFNATPLVDKEISLIENAANKLEKSITGWLETVPVKHNQAKQLALEIIGKSAVVYAGPNLAPAAYKWKISFNENAKHIAWWSQYPEFNHNEFIGWSQQPVDKPYAVIELRSDLEHQRIQKRFEISSRLLSGKKPESLVVNAVGETLLEQLLWVTALGDFTSIYLGLAGGINPTPVDLIEKFKKRLG